MARRPNRQVELATLAVIATGVLHDLDHLFNQPSRSIQAVVFVAAGLGWAAVLATLYMAHRGDPLAPWMALFTGLASAVGFVVSHLLPDFSPVSDSFVGLGVNALSWALVAISIAAGLALAAASQLFARRDTTPTDLAGVSEVIHP